MKFIRKTALSVSLLALAWLMIHPFAIVHALSDEQQRIYNSGVKYFEFKEPKLQESSGETPNDLVGECEPEWIWNYFKTESFGLEDYHIAGIMGNLARESGYWPTRVQGRPPEEGSKDPNSAGSSGWGLMQWTPGIKILDNTSTSEVNDGLLKQAGITTPVYEMKTQLDLVWWHMNNVSPTGVTNFIVGFKQTPNMREATRDFEDRMEGAGVVALETRVNLAQAAFDQGTSEQWNCAEYNRIRSLIQ